MDDERDPSESSRADAADEAAGRALLHEIEWLGEVLEGCEELPPSMRRQAAAMAAGRSRVPADGERIDFVARVRAADDAAGDARPLQGWLGAELTAWLDARLAGATLTALGLALREPVGRCVEARAALRARHVDAAKAFQTWYAAGRDDEERRAFAAASSVALDEAVDRWCALGCESDLRRYVASWQRSASGWAERSLGRGFELPVEELGPLRAVQLHLEAIRARTAAVGSIPRALARRMGVSEKEALRLLQAHQRVSERRDLDAVMRRRMPVIRPIAAAAATLERELRRAPRIEEIAARARVHPCLVELALDAAGSL